MKQVLTNFALFIDGRGYIGMAKEIELPKLAAKTQEYSAGGMAGPVKVPLSAIEAMEASFTLAAYDLEVLGKMGFVYGAVVPFTARGAINAEDGSVIPVLVSMRGHLTSIEPGTWKAAEENTVKGTLSLTYLRIEHNSAPVIEIDTDNAVLIVGGTDQLAATRAALGI